MAKARNTFTLDTAPLEGLVQKILDLDGDAREAVESALEQAAETISDDTLDAIAPGNLPAQGRYSTGATEASVLRDQKVRWTGTTAWIPVGFDFTMPGTGGYLISGTPKMQPVAQLRKMYKQKKYMADIQKDITDVLEDALIRAMEEG